MGNKCKCRPRQSILRSRGCEYQKKKERKKDVEKDIES